MLTVYMEREDVEMALSLIQSSNHPVECTRAAEMALTTALSSRSEPYNPLKDFGHVQDHPHDENDDDEAGLPAASDIEARDSIK